MRSFLDLPSLRSQHFLMLTLKALVLLVATQNARFQLLLRFRQSFPMLRFQSFQLTTMTFNYSLCVTFLCFQSHQMLVLQFFLLLTMLFFGLLEFALFGQQTFFERCTFPLENSLSIEPLPVMIFFQSGHLCQELCFHVCFDPGVLLY